MMRYKSTILFILIIFVGVSCAVWAIPVSDIPDLDSITFWERTGGSGPAAHTYGIDSAQLAKQLAEALSISNSDFGGVPGHEFYDVFFSDKDGTFNPRGEYLTIEGSYDRGLPYGGGLNLAEIGLNFIGEPTEYGNWVAGFVALGNNSLPETVKYAIDGDLLTHTTLGNTVGQSERLRVTLGFESSSGSAQVPEPATMILLVGGMVSLGVMRRCSIRRGRSA